jgi:hypothetical protein
VLALTFGTVTASARFTPAQEKTMGDKEKHPVPGASADNARREREKSISDDKSGAHEQQARKHAKDDIRERAWTAPRTPRWGIALWGSYALILAISAILSKTMSGLQARSASRAAYPQVTAAKCVPASRAAAASRVSSPI